tara:strand:- start:1912 stop:2418 length:507 start_codon:yes stop_codon:yes gene_type:complete
MAKNIVEFPISHSRGVDRSNVVSLEGNNLFGAWGDKKKGFVFLNIEELDQDKFLNVLIKNGVSCIFDFRSKPVFEQPKFRHREVIEYFNAYHIFYYDSAFLIHVSGADEGAFSVERLKSFLDDVVISGLIVFIVDGRLVRGINKNSIRGFVKNNSPEFIEVSPSSMTH